MSYTLWLKIENDDGSPGDDDEGWLQLAGDLERPAAVTLGNEISTLVERSKIADPSDPLDGWWGEGFNE